MLWFARRHPDTPLFAKIFCVAAVVYTLSPIDLIPDFIPLLGYLDDLVLVPVLIWMAIRMLPPHVTNVCREQARIWMSEKGLKPQSRIGAIIVIALWIFFAWLCWRWIVT